MRARSRLFFRSLVRPSLNPKYFGDSYDLVKRFFCRELAHLGYTVAIDAMLTGSWGESEHEFYRLIGAEPATRGPSSSTRAALFIDPDTGINTKGGRQHASFDRLLQEAERYELVFAFDQSFSRQSKAELVMREKLSMLKARGCHGMYYDSHARFVFAANERSVLQALQQHFVSLGLPSSRLLASDE